MRKWLLRFLLGLAVLIGLILVVPMLIPLPPVGADPATFAEPDGRFITVNGLQTYLREQGDPAAPTVLLLHGFGGSTFSWRNTLTPLAEAGFHVIAFDRPPYGLSAKTGDGIPYTGSAGADFTVALMDVLSIERATLVGHSAGGGVVAYFAVRYPERVNDLVFVDGAVRIDGQQQPGGSGRVSSDLSIPPVVNSLLGFEPIHRLAQLIIRSQVRPDAFADLQRSAYYDPADVTPEVAAGYAEQLQVYGWDEALINILRGAAFQDVPLTREQLGAVSAPTLILWGADDPWIPLSAGESLADALPNDQLISYPQVGHLPMEENVEGFNRDLIAFLLANKQEVTP